MMRLILDILKVMREDSGKAAHTIVEHQTNLEEF